MTKAALIVLLVLGLAALTSGALLAEPPKAAKAASALVGRITDDSGHPIAGVKIQLYSGFATRKAGQSATTDSDGRYRFDPLETGSGRQGVLAPGVTLTHAEYASGDGQTWWDVEVPLGQTVERNFTMVRGGTIRGTLTFGGGDWLLREFDVRIVSASKKGTAYGKTDNAGVFTTDALLPGEYTVQANDSRTDYPTIATVKVEAGKVVAFKARCTFSMTAERLE
jgi:hypothetical protein